MMTSKRDANLEQRFGMWKWELERRSENRRVKWKFAELGTRSGKSKWDVGMKARNR
jgi:hypothetical protein